MPRLRSRTTSTTSLWAALRIHVRQSARIAPVKPERVAPGRKKPPFRISTREFNRLHRRAYRAQQDEHREVCGVVLLDQQRQIRLRFVPNRLKTPYRHEMRRTDVASIAKRLDGRERILGTFHSHPLGEAKPSAADLRSGFFNGRELIYDVCAREVRLWRLVKSRRRLFELAVRVDG